MRKTKHTLIALSLLGAALSAGLAANSAAAQEVLSGLYIVAPSTAGAVPIYIEVQAIQDSQTITQSFACVLPNAEESQQVYCPQFDVSMPVEQIELNSSGYLIEVDYLNLAVWGEEHDYEVLSIEPTEPLVNSAEAEWTGPVTRWVCVIEPDDITKCNAQCAPSAGTVSAKPHPGNPDKGLPAYEPQCKVTCECDQGGSDWWIDMPQVLPG